MSVPTTFKAAIVYEKQGKNQIIDRKFNSPLQDDEVVVKINATAINPVDYMIRDLGLVHDKYPVILGSDAAGTIVAAGSKVSNLTVGDCVFFQGIIGNDDASTFQQYAKLSSYLVSKTPRNLTDQQAATVWVATAAVVTGLYDHTGLGLVAPWDQGGRQIGKGKAALILGGSSSVGQYAIQFAKLSGFERIITQSSPTHFEYLESLGANIVLDRNQAVSPKDYLDALQGYPLDFIFDSISQPTTQQLSVDIFQSLQSDNGKIVTVLPPNNSLIETQGENKIEIKFILGIGSYPSLRHLIQPLVQHLGGENGYLAQSMIRPNRFILVPGGLKAIDTAIEKIKQGVSGVKVIIQPFDD